VRISIIGTGYVGLTTAVGLASKGHDVIGVDKRQEQIDLIRQGKCPIYEKGLEELLQKTLSSRKFTLTSDTSNAVSESDISFICVGTPQAEDGQIDLGAIREVAEAIGIALRKKDGFHAVVVKSTVVPGTTLDVVGRIVEEKSGKKAGAGFGLAMVPEFLREGSALLDFLEPDRIVVGVEDARTEKMLSELFRNSFNSPVILVNTKTAEMIKYANNAFLALCISFSNEIAQVCERSGGIDAYDVMDAVTRDGRITVYGADGKKVVPGIAKYLIPGCGFGGSCFPKDLSALSHFGKKLGIKNSLVRESLEINETQMRSVADSASRILGGLKGRAVAVLGIAFKPETDDVRKSPAIPIIEGLLKNGAKVRAYDPQALANIRRQFGGSIEYSKSASEALSGAEMAVVVTRWKEFEKLAPEDFARAMKKARVFDCRGIYDRHAFSNKLEYYRIGYREA
jgi:nucleotide sugar dehydrogenase